jgi:hypothetical protein
MPEGESTMKAGIGFSEMKSAEAAVLEAFDEAVKISGDPAMTFLFTTDSYDQEKIYSTLMPRIGRGRLGGFCGGGIIRRSGVHNQGVGICTLSGDEIKVATSLQKNLSADPKRAGRQGGEALLESGMESGTVFVFPDGFSTDVPEMIRELYATMGHSYSYVGGGAGDNVRFFKTYQFTEEGIESDAAALVLIEGIHMASGIGHGWRPIKESFVITKIDGKRVIEIDGIPAFDAYRERIGEISAESFPQYGMRHPLGFPDIYGNYLIRDPFTVNRDHSIDFVVEVPGNSVGYLMEAGTEDIIKAASIVSLNVAEKVKKPEFVLVFDCISRYLMLGELFGKELEGITEAFDSSVPFLGALTFGEVGCHIDIPLYYNKTIAIVSGGPEPEGER